jgi:hypothetical protein
MAEFELLFAPQGGLKPILAGFLDRYRLRRYTTEDFRSYLEEAGRKDLSAFFARYVSTHPAALNAEELAAIR